MPALVPDTACRRSSAQPCDDFAGALLATPDGHVAQRSTLTTGHKTILTALELPEPPRFFDFSLPDPTATDAGTAADRVVTRPRRAYLASSQVKTHIQPSVCS